MAIKVSISFTLLLRSLFWLVLFSAFTAPGFAQEAVAPLDPLEAAEQQHARSQTLEKDEADIQRLRQELDDAEAQRPQKLEALKEQQLTEATLEQAKVDIDSARLRQQDLQTNITNAERRIKGLDKSIADLKSQQQLLKNPAKDEADEAKRVEQLGQVRKTLNQKQVDLDLEKQNLENLRTRAELANKRLSLAEQWLTQVDEIYRLQQEKSRLEAQEDLKQSSQKQKQSYQEEAAKYKQRLENERQKLSEGHRHLLEAHVQDAEERAKLVDLDLRVASIGNTLAKLAEMGEKPDVNFKEFQDGLTQLNSLQTELQPSAELLARKINLFEQQKQVIEQREGLDKADENFSAQQAKLVNQLIAALSDGEGKVQAQLTQIDKLRTELEAYYAKSLSEDLLAREELPANLEEAQKLLASLAGTPSVLLRQVWLSLQSMVQSVKEAEQGRWVEFMVVAIVLWIALMWFWRRLAQQAKQSQPLEGQDFSSNTVILFWKVVRKNIFSIGLTVTVLLVLWLFDVPQPGEGIITTLVLLWLSIKAAINLLKLLLDSPHLPPEQRRPKLYWQWTATLLVGGILMAISILAHLSALPDATIAAFDRVFSLFLLLSIVPVHRARRFLMTQLSRSYADQSWVLGIRFSTLLLPLLLLVVGLLGIVGYLNLALAIGWHAGVFIAVFMGWLVIQSLLNYSSSSLKGRAHRGEDAEFGFAQEIVAPLHRTLSIILFIAAAFVLYRAFDWKPEQLVENAWRPLVVAIISVIIVYEVIYFLADQVVKGSQNRVAQVLAHYSRKPMGFILPLTAAQLVTPKLALSEDIIDFVLHILVISQIAAISWLLVRMVSVFDEYAEQRYAGVSDKLAARRVRTQVRVLRQFIIALVYIVAIASTLMTFPTVRQLGAGMIASAGAAGLILGIAARPFLENLIAGIQIGLTQPIRIDDHVIVEGEWGSIEEINATYVVVHIWDDRRLIVPLNYFNTQPFQNWTHRGSRLIGSVFVHVDYTFPVDEGRRALQEILESTDLWDGQVWVLQVTDAKEHTVELRALMTACDAPTAWDLRCYVREKLITFIQDNYPQCLPKVRATLKEDEEKVALLEGQTPRAGSLELSRV